MKQKLFLMMLAMTVFLAGCGPVHMPKAPRLDLTLAHQHNVKAGIYFKQDVKDYVYKKQTSPFDSILFPLGEQTVQSFMINMPLAFSDTTQVDSKENAGDVDLIIEPTIVKFDSVIPIPAYKQYTATIVYHIDVFDKQGEKVFTQTVSGQGQTSKGILSGFFARQLCAESAQLAINDATKQMVEALSEADELNDITHE